MHPTSSCAATCQDGTFLSDPFLKKCSLCHPECNTCDGPDSNQCTTCYVDRGYNLQVDKTCQKGCLPGNYLVKINDVSQGYCLACNPECKECDNPSNQDCKECFNKEKMFLWEKGSDLTTGECVDCLDNYEYDNLDTNGRVCTMSREMEIVYNPWESVNYNASVSIKLRFMGIHERSSGRRRVL
jgi:hypothetical protein